MKLVEAARNVSAPLNPLSNMALTPMDLLSNGSSIKELCEGSPCGKGYAIPETSPMKKWRFLALFQVARLPIRHLPKCLRQRCSALVPIS
jgi:hypothetical protein